MDVHTFLPPIKRAFIYIINFLLWFNKHYFLENDIRNKIIFLNNQVFVRANLIEVNSYMNSLRNNKLHECCLMELDALFNMVESDNAFPFSKFRMVKARGLNSLNTFVNDFLRLELQSRTRDVVSMRLNEIRQQGFVAKSPCYHYLLTENMKILKSLYWLKSLYRIEVNAEITKNDIKRSLAAEALLWCFWDNLIKELEVGNGITILRLIEFIRSQH